MTEMTFFLLQPLSLKRFIRCIVLISTTLLITIIVIIPIEAFSNSRVFILIIIFRIDDTDRYLK